MKQPSGECVAHSEPALIERGDFVSLNDLLGRVAMASATRDLRAVAEQVFAAVHRIGAGLYLQQDAVSVPADIHNLCARHQWHVPVTDGEPPARFQERQRFDVLAWLYGAWVHGRKPSNTDAGLGKFMRLGRWVFARKAVGVDRLAAADIVADAVSRLAPVVPHVRPVTETAHGPVLTLVPSVESGTAEAVENKVVLPAGGSWPHKKGCAWTDAERVAMFKMRHKNKMTGAAIGVVVGCSRQCLDEQIGSVKLVNGEKIKSGWVPTGGLLKECGKALQALQAVALAAV